MFLITYLNMLPSRERIFFVLAERESSLLMHVFFREAWESYAIYCNLLWNCRLIYVVYNFISRRLHRKFENIKNENFPLTLSVTMVPIYQCNFWRRICLNCIRISMDGKTFYHQKNFKWIWVDPGFRDLWRLNNKSKCYFDCSTLFGERYKDSGSNRALWFKFLLGNYWCFDIKGQQELIVVCVTEC